jgi:hypothetical protein
VYLKNIIVMGAYTYGMFASLGRMMLWIVVGLPYTIIMVFWDVQLLFNILKMTKGCKHASDAADDMTVKPLEEEVQIKICQQVRETAIEAYIAQRKELKGPSDKQQPEEDEDEEENLDNWDVAQHLDDDLEEFGDLGADFTEAFMYKMKVIHDAWKVKRR